MIKRTMAVLGIMGFCITVLGGLIGGNGLEFIIPRALWAMCLFCFLGLIVGWSAEQVVREHRSKQHLEVFGPEDDEAPSDDSADAHGNSSTVPTASPIQN